MAKKKIKIKFSLFTVLLFVCAVLMLVSCFLPFFAPNTGIGFIDKSSSGFDVMKAAFNPDNSDLIDLLGSNVENAGFIIWGTAIGTLVAFIASIAIIALTVIKICFPKLKVGGFNRLASFIGAGAAVVAFIAVLLLLGKSEYIAIGVGSILLLVGGLGCLACAVLDK